jgi:hypothetical protein
VPNLSDSEFAQGGLSEDEVDDMLQEKVDAMVAQLHPGNSGGGGGRFTKLNKISRHMRAGWTGVGRRRKKVVADSRPTTYVETNHTLLHTKRYQAFVDKLLVHGRVGVIVPYRGSVPFFLSSVLHSVYFHYC